MRPPVPMRLPVPTFQCTEQIHLKIVSQSQTDRYNNPKVIADMDISNCVVNLETQYSGNNDNRQIVANGLVILYADYSTPMPALTKDNLQSKVTYNGDEYTVEHIGEFNQPYTSDLYTYELEVL